MATTELGNISEPESPDTIVTVSGQRTWIAAQYESLSKPAVMSRLISMQHQNSPVLYYSSLYPNITSNIHSSTQHRRLANINPALIITSSFYTTKTKTTNSPLNHTASLVPDQVTATLINGSCTINKQKATETPPLHCTIFAIWNSDSGHHVEIVPDLLAQESSRNQQAARLDTHSHRLLHTHLSSALHVS